MTTEERLDRIEESVRQMAEALGTLVGILVEESEGARTFGPRPDVFQRRRQNEKEA